MSLFGIISPVTLLKVSSLDELIFVFFPTVIGYFSGISIFFPIPLGWKYLIFVIIFIPLFVIFMWCRKRNYERAIAEALETGYFMNFIEGTASFISSRKIQNKSIVINSADGKSITVDSDKINVKVILPESLSKLNDTIAVVEELTNRGSLENGTWILYEKNIGEKLTIYDYPRTMTSMGKYLKDMPGKYDELKSKTLHKYFNARFKDDWDTAAETISKNTFMIIKVPPNFTKDELMSQLIKLVP